MRAHRVKAHVTPNQPLVVPLPADIAESDVEVIVLFPEPLPKTGAFASLREFDAWLSQQPPSGRSKEDMDRQIEEERAAWD